MCAYRSAKGGERGRGRLFEPSPFALGGTGPNRSLVSAKRRLGPLPPCAMVCTLLEGQAPLPPLRGKVSREARRMRGRAVRRFGQSSRDPQ